MPYRLLFACLALFLAGEAASAATPEKIDHIRGIILGTTIASLDVGTPSRADIHLEMSLEPYVVIAEPSDVSAIVPGAFVSVLTGATGVRCVVIAPDTAHVFAAGRTKWDVPGVETMLTSGRVSAVVSHGSTAAFTLGYSGTSRRFQFAKAPVIALRPGSRAALLSPHNVFVFASPPTTDLTDSIRSVIVADGPLALPF